MLGGGSGKSLEKWRAWSNNFIYALTFITLATPLARALYHCLFYKRKQVKSLTDNCQLQLQSWTKYIETTTEIQVEHMNTQLRLRIGIF